MLKTHIIWPLHPEGQYTFHIQSRDGMEKPKQKDGEDRLIPVWCRGGDGVAPGPMTVENIRSSFGIIDNQIDFIWPPCTVDDLNFCVVFTYKPRILWNNREQKDAWWAIICEHGPLFRNTWPLTLIIPCQHNTFTAIIHEMKTEIQRIFFPCVLLTHVSEGSFQFKGF